MAVRENENRAVFSYLRSLHFHFLDDWVVQCIDYCKSTKPNLTIEEIKEAVKEQWLLVDLRNLKVPSLPPNLLNVHKTILHGKYMVQVEKTIDCSKSCYSQFQEMCRIDVDNSETKQDNFKSSRCLLFTIFDGVQELHAMEYKNIKKFRTNDPELLPGFKMLIIGPVECRKGMILLQEENVEIYGGEVDTLTATNSLKSLLMSKLNLSEEDYPEISNKHSPILSNKIDCSECSNEIAVQSKSSSPASSKNIDKDILLSMNDDLFFSSPLKQEIFIEENSLSINDCIIESPSDLDDNRAPEKKIGCANILISDSDKGSEFSVPTIRKHDLPHEDKTTPSPKKVCSDNKTMNVSQLHANESVLTVLSSDWWNDKQGNDANKKLPKNYSKTSDSCDKIKESVQTTISSFFKKSNSQIGKASSSSSSSSTCETALSGLTPKNMITISCKPFVYLSQIAQSNLQHPCIYTIKGTIMTLKSNITIEKNEYSLTGTITDGSLSIDVQFSTGIIEILLEYSPCEMQDLIKAKQFNSAIASRINDAFKKAQEKFISLYCLMKIKYFPDGKLPVVLSVKEITNDHLNFLKCRKKFD